MRSLVAYLVVSSLAAPALAEEPSENIVLETVLMGCAAKAGSMTPHEASICMRAMSIATGVEPPQSQNQAILGISAADRRKAAASKRDVFCEAYRRGLDAGAKSRMRIPRPLLCPLLPVNLGSATESQIAEQGFGFGFVDGRRPFEDVPGPGSTLPFGSQ